MKPPEETKLVNPPAGQTKMVKCKVISGIAVKRLGGVQPAGKFVELTEAEAKEFCDQTFVGPYNFDGERGKKNATRTLLRRAVRVSDLEAIERLEAAKTKAMKETSLRSDEV